LAIQKKISGHPLSSLREIEPDLPLYRLTRSGLPHIIKLCDRSAIINGSLSTIRYWLTILSIYRILKGPFKPKLNTITDPPVLKLDIVDDFHKFLTIHSQRLMASFLQYPISLEDFGSHALNFITKASPNSQES
jgi:hypothetical protein